MSENIGEMPLPKVNVRVSVHIRDFRTLALNIIERERGKEPEIMASSTDLRLTSLVIMGFGFTVFFLINPYQFFE